MKTIFDYISIVCAYCLGCQWFPICQKDQTPCLGYEMNKIGIDMILRGEY